MMKISIALLIAAVSSTATRVSAQQELSFLRGNHGSHNSKALDDGDEDETPKKELRGSYAAVRLGGSGAGQAGQDDNAWDAEAGCYDTTGSCFTNSNCCSGNCDMIGSNWGVCERGTKARGDSCAHSDECRTHDAMSGCVGGICGGSPARQPTTPASRCSGDPNPLYGRCSWGVCCARDTLCTDGFCGGSPDRPALLSFGSDWYYLQHLYHPGVPYPGYCHDTQGRMYSSIYAPTSTNNIHNHEGGPVEGCASWCLYFRDPGLVGFMITTRVDGSTNYCACHYSADTLPINPRTSVDHSSQTNTGRGPVASGDGTANVSCYPVEVYDGPDNSDQE